MKLIMYFSLSFQWNIFKCFLTEIFFRRVLYAEECEVTPDWRVSAAQLLQHQPSVRRSTWSSLGGQQQHVSSEWRSEVRGHWSVSSSCAFHSASRCEDSSIRETETQREVSSGGDEEVEAGGGQWPHQTPGTSHRGCCCQDSPGALLQSAIPGKDISSTAPSGKERCSKTSFAFQASVEPCMHLPV